MSAVVATQPRGSRAGGDAQKALSLDALTSTPQVRLLRRPQRGGLALVYAPQRSWDRTLGPGRTTGPFSFAITAAVLVRSSVAAPGVWDPSVPVPNGWAALDSPVFFTGGLSRSWLWTRRQRQALAQGSPRGPLPGCLRDAWSPPLTRLAFFFLPGVSVPLCACCLCPTCGLHPACSFGCAWLESPRPISRVFSLVVFDFAG